MPFLASVSKSLPTQPEPQKLFREEKIKTFEVNNAQVQFALCKEFFASWAWKNTLVEGKALLSISMYIKSL